MPDLAELTSGAPADAEVRWRLPHTLTVLPTYKCTAACKECCFQSNPWITHRVPQDRLLGYIDQAAELGTIRVVCFSGGEPFLLDKDLVELVVRCQRYAFMTRIVTNGYWAVNEKGARARLGALVTAGLNELNFSTGDDHANWVPVSRIVQGLDVAYDMGLSLALMIETGADRLVTKQAVLDAAASFPTLLNAIETNAIPVLESPWMQFAPESGPVPQTAYRLTNAQNVHLREPCTSVLTTVVVTPNEQLGMCCGLPREGIPDLHAGDLRERRMKDLAEESSRDFLKMWLFVEGPERILAWAARKNPAIAWENMYAHNCDACRRMYTDPQVMDTIVAHYEEKYDEVLLKFASYMTARSPR